MLPIKIPAGLGPKRSNILRVADQEIGTREVPPGSNRGPVEKYFPPWMKEQLHLIPPGELGPSWCAFFTGWVWKRALGQIPTGIARASVARLRDDAEGLALFKPLRAGDPPVPGDAFILDHGGGKGHIGIVRAIHPNMQQYFTVEGNSGHKVRLGVRDMSDPKLQGWVHAVIGERTDGIEFLDLNDPAFSGGRRPERVGDFADR